MRFHPLRAPLGLCRALGFPLLGIVLGTAGCSNEHEAAPASPPAGNAPSGDARAGDAPAARPGNLRDPATATATAPAQFRFRFKTTKGDVVLESHRDWAPLGVDRLYNLVTLGFFTDIACFRVVPGFVVQFGLHGDPDVSRAWSSARLQDEPVQGSNKRGYLTYAKMAIPNTRSTQFFVNLGDNQRLDGMGFSPVARVVEGMEVFDKIHAGYGERPRQDRIEAEGNAYLKKDFPQLDYILSAQIEKADK